MTTIDNEFWDNLSEKGQWDIKVAMRGPDSYYGETLKWFTTSVLRGVCKKVFRVGGTINKDLKLVILPTGDIHIKRSKKGWNHEHFCEHIQIAAEWLHVPILYVPADLWHDTMPSKSKTTAALAFLNYGDTKLGEPEPKYGLPNDQLKSKLAELRRHYMEQLGGGPKKYATDYDE